ncbi:hypothetical protein DdX_11261 [Ditylenchus destructor]|uniref:Uncharacterized protein n=1 Tax=Ditylenchus destructor TaxID=166010 RepID=A0AAD4R1D9_9BILA|nr:hypothetical protein DdX_11261 [Ditylenchus destructor]
MKSRQRSKSMENGQDSPAAQKRRRSQSLVEQMPAANVITQGLGPPAKRRVCKVVASYEDQNTSFAMEPSSIRQQKLLKCIEFLDSFCLMMDRMPHFHLLLLCLPERPKRTTKSYLCKFETRLSNTRQQLSTADFVLAAKCFSVNLLVYNDSNEWEVYRPDATSCQPLLNVPQPEYACIALEYNNDHVDLVNRIG